jgi:hypothetical protein
MNDVHLLPLIINKEGDEHVGVVYPCSKHAFEPWEATVGERLGVRGELGEPVDYGVGRGLVVAVVLNPVNDEINACLAERVGHLEPGFVPNPLYGLIGRQ